MKHWLSVKHAQWRAELDRRIEQRIEDERHNPILRDIRFGVAYIGGIFMIAMLLLLLIAGMAYAVTVATPRVQVIEVHAPMVVVYPEPGVQP